MSKSVLACVLFVALFSICSAGQSASGEESYADGKAAIEQVLRSQADAWNRHDLEAFMSAYCNCPELTFFSAGQEQRGWQATLERYKARYTGPGHEMGNLEFPGLTVRMLGPDAAYVRGHWHLTMPDGKNPHGLFTLVFRKMPDGWKIVHDHTSAVE